LTSLESSFYEGSFMLTGVCSGLEPQEAQPTTDENNSIFL
jgi:hypothetical protein